MSANVFQRLYDSEINFEVSCFWDAHFDVRLGDAVNGFLAQDNVPTWDAVGEWLHCAALRFYPNSDYAKQALGAAWRPTDDQAPPFVLINMRVSPSSTYQPSSILPLGYCAPGRATWIQKRLGVMVTQSQYPDKRSRDRNCGSPFRTSRAAASSGRTWWPPSDHRPP
jgi:hypothetical protein